jgi:hypothetical protein
MPVLPSVSTMARTMISAPDSGVLVPLKLFSFVAQ